jgi:glycosyltransferase involved in cell wall biosynthesis
MITKPFVSIVLPIRNEEGFIEATLDTIRDQDYPNDKLEVIIADGMSTDKTPALVSDFVGKNPSLNIHLINNPEQTVSYGLNRAIRGSSGAVIVRMDAHSVYPRHYISRLVESLDLYGAHNTGGIVDTVPAQDNLGCRAIAAALSHPIGVGNSYFRIGSSTVREVDTVPFGCFRREIFESIGFFDEALVRNQDDEFNGRIRNAGMKIVLVPDVVVTYFARDSFLKLFKMYYQYGLYKPLASYKLGGVPTVRQLVPLLFVLFLIGGTLLSLIFKPILYLFAAGLIFYFLTLTVVALRESVKQKKFLVMHLVLAFFILHFSYGYGYLKGFLALIFKRTSVFDKKTLSR